MEKFEASLQRTAREKCIGKSIMVLTRVLGLKIDRSKCSPGIDLDNCTIWKISFRNHINVLLENGTWLRYYSEPLNGFLGFETTIKEKEKFWNVKIKPKLYSVDVWKENGVLGNTYLAVNEISTGDDRRVVSVVKTSEGTKVYPGIAEIHGDYSHASTSYLTGEAFAQFVAALQTELSQ